MSRIVPENCCPIWLLHPQSIWNFLGEPTKLLLMLYPLSQVTFHLLPSLEHPWGSVGPRAFIPLLLLLPKAQDRGDHAWNPSPWLEGSLFYLGSACLSLPVSSKTHFTLPSASLDTPSRAKNQDVRAATYLEVGGGFPDMVWSPPHPIRLAQGGGLTPAVSLTANTQTDGNN